MAIFDKNTMETIEYGIVFEQMEGGNDIAEQMYQRAVRLNARTNADKDVLEFFYGEDVYSRIKTASCAAESICVATELKAFYEKIQSVGCYNADNGWAKTGTINSVVLRNFFAWLYGTHSAPRTDDISVIKSATKLLEGSAKATYKIVDSRIQCLSFFALVEKIVGKEISVATNGDLIWKS